MGIISSTWRFMLPAPRTAIPSFVYTCERCFILALGQFALLTKSSPMAETPASLPPSKRTRFTWLGQGGDASLHAQTALMSSSSGITFRVPSSELGRTRQGANRPKVQMWPERARQEERRREARGRMEKARRRKQSRRSRPPTAGAARRSPGPLHAAHVLSW